jgi:hypothetical protein
MRNRSWLASCAAVSLLAGTLPANAAQPATAVPLGTVPPAAAAPRAEFVFEEHVTLAPAVVLGATDYGERQYIPLTGGVVAGPKLKGDVIPGGWDYQLRTAGGCSSLSADYFLRASDGVVIHVLNQAFSCPGGPEGERSWARPTFEAPKGSAHEWLTRGTFVASIEVERAPGSASAAPVAVRIRFYQIK